MSAYWASLAAFLLSACATLVPPPAGTPSRPSAREAHDAYAHVLDRFVDDRGRVDFAALSRDRSDLDTYVRFIAVTALDSIPPGDPRLAHFINSYNALSMYNVIASGIPKTHAGWHKLVFFALRKFVIGGRATTLYAYENDVIRKVGDPRIHFALNCSALGCPELPRVPFEAASLQVDLDRVTRQFFAAHRNFHVARSSRTVYVSELLSFYREDFGGADAALIRFMNRYAPESVPEDFAVRFMPYDWTVANAVRMTELPKEGR